ncbi:dCTP deaminase [Amycolatopsis sp. NPDC051071]|uniref:dCTP deaminase n=1 Tax=Amycolatopsis sp. NPDC051071 TaxID=3154637 RepID=UPI003415DCE2
MLTDREIDVAVHAGEVVIRPFNFARSRPASYLLRLGNRFMRASREGGPINPFLEADVNGAFGDAFEAQALRLEPGDFVLGATAEEIGLPPWFVGRITGMSHLGRLGLTVHVTADTINPGFGYDAPTAITLELVNHHPRPLILRAGMPICHLQLHRLAAEPARAYHKSAVQYSGPNQPTASRYWAEFGDVMP